MSLDVARVRRDFPALSQSVRGKPLVYLDSAATAQTPRAVIDAVAAFSEGGTANVHRAVHTLSEKATAAYEGARETVRRFVNAAHAREIVFVRGTTEALNLIAHTRVRPGDEVVVTALEHHSNIVPWQLAGARVVAAPIDERGELLIDQLPIGPKTKLVSVAHVSNALGTVLPVQRIVELAHAQGVPVVVDGAQAAPHLPVDVRALGCDFYAFSGHKLYGPGGIGVLYGREALLEAMPPWQGGGDMISSVRFEGSSWNALPWKFEAGTPHVAGAVGLAAAINYIAQYDFDSIQAHERGLLDYAAAKLCEVPEVRLVGTARERASVQSFLLGDVHPHDIGAVLDSHGIAIRAGHHCAQPLMQRLGIAATARASFALYNTRDEIDALAQALGKVRELFR